MSKKPNIHIGTIGHKGHGKSTLTDAITEVLKNTNKLFKKKKVKGQEEQRGITVSINSIEYDTENRHYIHIDYRGEQEYIKGLLTGTLQMDGAILIVSVEEGLPPETAEQIKLAKRIGIEHIIVFLNQMSEEEDLELLELCFNEIRNMLSEEGYLIDKIPIITGNALKALKNPKSKKHNKCIFDLLSALDLSIAEPIPVSAQPFLMYIEEVLFDDIRGTKVLGTVKRGKVVVGDEIEIWGAIGGVIKTMVSEIAMLRKKITKAEVGDNIALFLPEIDRYSLERGFLVMQSDSMLLTKNFIAEIYLLSSGVNDKIMLYENQMVEFRFHKRDVGGAIHFTSDTDSIVSSGENTSIKVELVKAIPLENGSRFRLRINGNVIGAGIINSVFSAQL